MTDSFISSCCAHPKLALGKQNGQNSNGKNTKSIHPEVFVVAWLLDCLLGLSMCTKTAKQPEPGFKMNAQTTTLTQIHRRHRACTLHPALHSMPVRAGLIVDL